MRKIINIFLLLTTILVAETITGKVISVTDGDTIKILDEKNKVYKIRLNDIDAPEKNKLLETNQKRIYPNI